MNKQTIYDLKPEGKTIYKRVDYNVPHDKEGHITDEELSMVKTMLINALSKVDDDPDSIISFNWRRDIINSQDTIEDKQNAIKNVTKKDVIKCAQSIELDTIYFLTGKEFYEENLLSNN